MYTVPFMVSDEFHVMVSVKVEGSLSIIAILFPSTASHYPIGKKLNEHRVFISTAAHSLPDANQGLHFACSASQNFLGNSGSLVWNNFLLTG